MPWLSIAFVLLGLTPVPTFAQNLTGDYVLAVDGSAILGIALRQAEDGRITGSVSAGGKVLPLSGVLRGTGAVFVSAAPDGSRLHWQVQPQPDGLAVIMAPPGIDGQPDPTLAQRHVFVRARARSGGLRQASQKWIGRLASAADSIVSWCSSPMYASSDLCVSAMRVLRQVAPALMVARFATSGQAGSLMRVLAHGPVTDPMAPPPSTTATGEESFFSMIEPPTEEEFQEPPTLDAYSGAPPAVSEMPDPPARAGEGGTAPVPTLAQRLLAAKPTPSGNASINGEYVMLHAGSELLRVRLAAGAEGAIGGTLSLLGTPFPLTGTVANGTVSFRTQAPSGEVGVWQGQVAGDRLSLTLTTSSGSERYELVRQGSGWSESAPLAQEWDAALRGNTVAHSAGARDPVTGASVETLLHFCADGILRLEIGADRGGSEPAWRVVATNEQAAVELRSREGTIQVGLERQGEGLLFAGQPARIIGPADACP